MSRLPLGTIVACLATSWLALAPVGAAAQTLTSASVTGTVHDAGGGIVPGATVEIVNQRTNQQQQAVTDARGRFRLLYLPVGEYSLSVELTGFGSSHSSLTLQLGDQIDVPIVLQPANVTEAVQVEAPAPVVETRRTQVASAVTPREVDTLPLNGRNYLDLALLAPNVSRTNLKSTDRFAETSAVAGTAVSVSGQRNLANNFIVDGLSANDDAADLAGTFFSEDVVREFQVVTSGGIAEFGRASGGTISVVTKSGGNDLSGRVYEFFRDDMLDARNPLSTRRNLATNAPLKDPLRQNQFGVSLGGPIVKDRTFGFGNFERTQLDRTGIVTIAPVAAAAINRVLDRDVYGGPRVATGNYATGYNTTNVFGRVDHQATPRAHVQLRYSLYTVGSDNARNVGALNDVSRGAALDDTDQTAAVNILSTLSSGTINEARAQYTHSVLAAPVNDIVGPAVNISGVASWGTATFSPTGRRLDVIQAVDTMTFQRGDHLVKAGGDLLYNRVRIDFPGALQGVYNFTSLANFDRGVYSTFQQAFGAVSQFQSNPNLGLFVQDEWRLRPDVTLNAGVRYDLQWLPDPVQLDANNVSPRVGIAYAPGDARTVVRASAGLYFDRIPLRATSNALQRDGSKYQVAQLSFDQPAAPVWPSVLPVFPAGLLASVTTIEPGIQDGRSMQAGVEVERALGHAMSASIGYTHLRGRHIILSRNVNVPTLTAAEANALGIPNLGRPNPNFGNINQYESIGDSWWDAMTLSLLTRTAPWGQARVSYTLGTSFDTAGNAFFQTPQDNADVLGDKGPSDNDQRQRIVVSGTFGDGSSAAIRRALGGVQIGYLFAYAGALPFNPQAGVDLNNDTTINDRPLGMGRNSDRMPCWAESDRSLTCGTTTLDVRLSRTLRFGSRHQVELMAEGFNVFNHTNVVNINSNFGPGTMPWPAYKQITAVADKRQFQLGLRWAF
jgi:Carboxypeptidase regulatory-like domain/TonB dependent receptor-like, beta-barrel